MDYLRAGLLALCGGFLFSGCDVQTTNHMSANLSLVEIGERSLESAERFEAAGRWRDADISYRRALWAFSYHERLTGEQPLLLDEARNGTSRMAKTRAPAPAPRR